MVGLTPIQTYLHAQALAYIKSLSCTYSEHESINRYMYIFGHVQASTNHVGYKLQLLLDRTLATNTG